MPRLEKWLFHFSKFAETIKFLEEKNPDEEDDSTAKPPRNWLFKTRWLLGGYCMLG